MLGRASGFLAVLALAALAGCGGTRTVVETRTVTVAPGRKQSLAPPRERLVYGHIRSLVRARGRWTMRFDPALLLSGETANVAAAEDGSVEPGQPVPNDNYVLDEGHRLLTFRVADDARVTVLTRRGDPAGLGATPVSVPELARIVGGKSSLDLFEPLDTGVWIAYDVDTVHSIDQQYRP